MSNITTTEFSCLVDYLSDDVIQVIIVLNFVLLTAITGFVGLVVNVIKLFVFVQLGLKDSTNISFLALSIADTGVTFSLIGISVVYSTDVPQAVTYFESLTSIALCAVGWPYCVCSRIAMLMTAVITAERFLCVAFPLKVKMIMNPTTSYVTSIAVFCSVTVAAVPAFISCNIGPMYNHRINQTTLGFMATETAVFLQSKSFLAMTFIEFVSLGVIILFTSLLIQQLIHQTKWRNQVATTTVAMTTRDKKLIKMVIFISISFLVFSLSGLIYILMGLLITKFQIFGPCRYLYLIIYSIISPTDALNSLVNFFIFLHMSSNFRKICKQMVSSFHLQKVFTSAIR